LSEVPYVILFENLADSATAPAHEVFIRDTLDLEKFDMSYFSFGTFGWGDTVLTQPPGEIREFLRDIDLRPAQPTIVRVSGKIDTITGVVDFYFATLDTLMNEEEDPFLGFLPPNDENGIGEGFVSYTVGLKPITTTGYTIENQATIVFDANKPIMTNLFVNTFDLDKPQSSISGVIRNDSLRLSWSGTDLGSGIAYYDVYLQKDSGAWELLLYQTVEIGISIPIDSGVKAYKFYCIATDNVGWEEDWDGNYETVYAYIVTFNSQGGSSVPSQTTSQGEKVTKPTDPTRANHRFDGWFKESTGTNAWNFAVDTIVANTTLYAKWTDTATTNIADLMNEQTTLQVFPNPTDGKLTVVIPSEARNLPAIVEIFDMNGKRVYSHPIPRTPNPEQPFSIDMTPFQSGNYILRIGNRVAKVVKQ
jgi:uncharacterized repeat protein (TIGR02543 family)